MSFTLKNVKPRAIFSTLKDVEVSSENRRLPVWIKLDLNKSNQQDFNVINLFTTEMAYISDDTEIVLIGSLQ